MRKRLEDELTALREQDQFRELSIPIGIDLGSNDYLGLSSDFRLKDAIIRAVRSDLRVASTGSRLLSGNSERWEALEAEFAEFAGADAALYFPSGYAANIGLLSSVLKRTDTVFSDSSNHASIIDGIRLSLSRKVTFPHLDLEYLEQAMRRTEGTGDRFLVVESVFSMEGDRAPLQDLMVLCERYDVALIVDEAHSIGVDGPQGRGMMASIGRSEALLATVHTCGKALASMGAFVAGSRILRDFLINRARTFIFTTALPSYCAAQIREALKLVREADVERARLRELGHYLRQRLQAAGFDAGGDSQIVPLVLGSNDAALHFASAVSAAGFAVKAIRPPTVPAGTARLRLSLNAKLSLADLDAVTQALVAAREGEVVRK